MSNNHGTHLFNEEAQNIFRKFVSMSGIEIIYIEPNLSWLKELGGVL
jgi:hypothetical protein